MKAARFMNGLYFDQTFQKKQNDIIFIKNEIANVFLIFNILWNFMNILYNMFFEFYMM